MPQLDLNEIQSRVLLAARGKRQSTLSMFRPTAHQEPFFLAMEKDMILEMLLGGANRSGKSVCAAIAMASLILNEPVIFRDGSEHYMRPPRWRGDPLKVWIVGFDWKHIGKTIYRLLFKKGLFKVIRDQKTGKYRAWNPELPGEDKQFANTKPSPPLIPMTAIKGGENGISWENKKENQISSCDMSHDGTRVEFFASTGARPQGDPAHIIWIDEKIDDGRWYSELLMRLMDDRGRVMWTAWADTAPSMEMSAIQDRALAQSDKPDQMSFAIRLRGVDNPYTRGKHRDAMMDTLDDDERMARDEGLMNMDRWRPYSRFDKWKHRAVGLDPAGDDKLAKAIREAGGVPGSWTRYLILDPGTANPAVLMVAVPPPDIGDFIVPYDELYLKYTPAEPLTKAIMLKTAGTIFEEFIIDGHAAQQTPMGFDGTVGENYEHEFQKAGLRCRRRGSRFSFGSDNVMRRIMGVQGTLNIRPDGTPRLRVYGCAELVKQLENYRWAADPKGNPLDVPAKYQRIDLAVTLEYFVSRSDCGYVAPVAVPDTDPRSKEAVMKSLTAVFGEKNSMPQTSNRTVYCGAGSFQLR